MQTESFRKFSLRAGCTIPAMAVVLGCSAMPPGSGVGGVQEPTASELASVDAALQAMSAVVRGGDALQNVAAPENLSGAQVSPGDATFGTCPIVTTAVSAMPDIGLEITVDYGDGCASPLAPNYTCSGAASGSLTTAGATLTVTFDELTCNGDLLDGSVELALTASRAAVRLGGLWSLTHRGDGEEFMTVGEGTTAYDRQTGVTTVELFDGSVTASGTMTVLSASQVLVSFQMYGSLVPFGGTLSVSGSDVRPTTVRFNEDSPTAGEVEMSLDGSPYFVVTLPAR